MSRQDTTLPAEAASVPVARRFVRAALTELGASGAIDTAESLVSELATNVVLHARTPFTIEASRDGDIIRICVLDASPVPARLRSYGSESTTGRGLRLVASQASDWGMHRQGPGKVVWFEIAADGPAEEVVSWDDEVDPELLLAGFDDDAGHPSPGGVTVATVGAASHPGWAA